MNKQFDKNELINIFSKIGSNKKLLQDFLSDLLSSREFAELVQIWQIVKELDSGATQREVARKLKTTVVTINRGARMLNNPSGGFNQILRKLG